MSDLNDNVWSYRDSAWTQENSLVGYDVYASDGSIGTIDEASNDAGSQWLVVDTGFWIFGKKRLIPAGAITAVDHNGAKVTVSMTKDQIKTAPDYDRDDWTTTSAVATPTTTAPTRPAASDPDRLLSAAPAETRSAGAQP